MSQDINDLFRKRIDKMMSDHPELFPTESKVWAYLRGCLRRGIWNKSPMKFKYKESQLTPPPPDYTGRGKRGAICALSGEWTMTSKMEVDHKEGNLPLLCVDDIIPYIIHLLASGEDELQVVSKEAHKIKSHAERYGMTYEEARLDKAAIAIGSTTKKEKDFIKKAGKEPGKNAKIRRQQIIEILKEREQ